MHSGGRERLTRCRRILLLACLVLAAACKKPAPAPSAPASPPDLSMPSRSASSSPPAHPVDPGMERLLTAHYGNDEAKKEEVRGTVRALDAEADAAEKLAEENRRTMIIPAPPDFKPESVDRKVRLRLALQNTKLHPGDFLRIRLEMTNVGRQAIAYHEIGGGIFKYGNLSATRSVSLYVTDPSGHREKLDAAPASRKVKGAKPVDTGFNFLPANMPAADKEKWLQKTMAESAASQYFQVKLLPGEGGVPKAVEIVVAFGWSPDSIRFVSPDSSHATAKALSASFSTAGTPAPIVS